MTDLRLRSLQRRAALGGPDARARLFRERVRSGDLSPNRLSLAAHLGHVDAREVLGEDAPAAEPNLLEWMRGLEVWGRDVCALAGLLCARLGYQGPDVEHPVSDLVVASLDAAEAWLTDPSPARVEATRDALAPALETLFRRPRYSYTPRVFNAARSGVTAAAVVLHPSTLLNPHYTALIRQSLGLRQFSYSLGTLAAAAGYWTLAAGVTDREALRELLRRHLVEWVLRSS